MCEARACLLWMAAGEVLTFLRSHFEGNVRDRIRQTDSRGLVEWNMHSKRDNNNLESSRGTSTSTYILKDNLIDGRSGFAS
ncbi:hypothetical protein SODALDRAFT_335275 [Sodiomyces alkalinus F11]|uniref:Uncharacterized protein n=1 Tax=Sodiomyces alkalinus (strain CBS 110278 / VKM F-3762 / F11) TaxID=1314773 RepID=A0A3N2PP55_SODAK|nr:hypothetical protein SODALDRAFT_335275 [Sodiomyces alkalinus F11]ROT36204.1 hypothetical protein SODALDRAFT_335275 [Sodiomyces alkalinus F11]